MEGIELEPGVFRTGRELIRFDYARHGRPLDWTRVFGRTAPLELEIGTSSGEFLCRRAQDQPDRDHVGIEIKNDRVRRFVRRAAKLELTNVVCVHADVEQVIGCLFSAASLARIYLLFPDPWPKKRHHKNRVLNRHTLDIFAALLAPGGHLHLATDDAPYLAWMRSHVAAHPRFAGSVSEQAANPFGYPTRYETYWMAEGRTITHLDCPVRDAPASGR